MERFNRHDTEPYNWFVVSLRFLERRDGKEAALDYMKKLAAQQIQWRKGHSLIGQLMAAGEFPIASELQVHTVERAKAQGAPVEWAILDGVIPISKVAAAITSTGANVFSSALFYDFLLSRPGMETIRASRRIPTRPDMNRDVSEAVQAFAFRTIGNGRLRQVRHLIPRHV